MDFKWIQLRSKDGEMAKWGLYHKETGKLVMILALSNYGTAKEKYRIRKKIQTAYNRYFSAVWFNNLRFF